MTMVSAPPPAIAANSAPSLTKGRQSALPPLGAMPSSHDMGRFVSATPSDVSVPPLAPALDMSLLPTTLAAVNHLCAARVRLLATMPTVGMAWSLWCGRCGALREGFGGACAYELRDKSGSATPSSTTASRKRSINGELKNLSMDADLDAEGEDASPADELERELHRTLAAMANGCNTPPAMPPQRRRKSPRCTACGSKFRRPQPQPARFPPARSVARTRRQSSLAAEVKNEEPEATSTTPASSAAPSSNGSPAGSPVASPGPNALSRTPSLQHIPTSHPSTPTYPNPPVVPPPTSGGTTPPVSIPPGGGAPPAKKRKTKKSGLAKLLAQNAQRAAEKNGSGMWGLG